MTNRNKASGGQRWKTLDVYHHSVEKHQQIKVYTLLEIPSSGVLPLNVTGNAHEMLQENALANSLDQVTHHHLQSKD